MAMYLLAQSQADVPPLSALVQDAAVRVADIQYDRKARQLVLLMARYCWENAVPTRSRAALRFAHVLGVQQRGMTRDATLALLSVAADDDIITLDFSGGAALRVQAEAIDMILEDFGAPWPAIRCPAHGA